MPPDAAALQDTGSPRFLSSQANQKTPPIRPIKAHRMPPDAALQNTGTRRFIGRIRPTKRRLQSRASKPPQCYKLTASASLFSRQSSAVIYIFHFHDYKKAPNTKIHRMSTCNGHFVFHELFPLSPHIVSTLISWTVQLTWVRHLRQLSRPRRVLSRTHALARSASITTTPPTSVNSGNTPHHDVFFFLLRSTFYCISVVQVVTPTSQFDGKSVVQLTAKDART